MRYTSRQKEKISKLFSIYPENIEFIPQDDPFKFLVTVILSASSTDIKACKGADELFAIAPTPSDIAKMEVSDIERIIHFVGLGWGKAKSIKALSEVAAKSGIPETLEELTAIPGIGEKTANCYLVNILGKPGVIVDTHFARTASRLGLVKATERNAIYKEIKNDFPPEIWSRLSMTVNLHGRTYCTARTPKCSDCPLKSLCPYGRKTSVME